MKFKWDKKYLYWGITAFLVIVLSISFFILASNYRKYGEFFQTVMKILKPFVIGFVIAYLLNPVMVFIEKKVVIKIFSKTKLKENKKLYRICSMTIALILAILVLIALFSMVLPQLVDSIKGIVASLPSYVENLEKWLSGLLSSNQELSAMLSAEVKDMNGIVADWLKINLLPRLDSIISGVTTGLIGVVVLLKDLLLGIIISVYVLYSKEFFVAQSKKLLYAVLPLNTATSTLSIVRRSHGIFGKFIIGKIIDSLIIGILCFIGMSIFQMPYALLISVIIGVTNIVPFFGPFIGAIPSGLLILMIDPLTCLYFVIFILALQQFDGNILGPKILGDSTGLSAFWVVFAILIAGGLFGFPGMVVGVPAFAVIYSLIVEALQRRLKRKNLPIDTAEFYNLDKIETDENETKTVYFEK